MLWAEYAYNITTSLLYNTMNLNVRTVHEGQIYSKSVINFWKVVVTNRLERSPQANFAFYANIYGYCSTNFVET